MPAFTLLSLTNVNLAIETVANIRGVYQSIGLLSKALADVEETDEFKNEVRSLENQQGPLYQGPDNTRAAVLKAAKTAANGDGEQQDAMAKLLALIIERFGTGQGSRVLGFLLMAAGIDPTLSVFVIKICVFLVRTEAGKKVLEQAQPQLVKLAEASGQAKLFKPLAAAAKSAGEQSTEWVDAVVSAASSGVKTASSFAVGAATSIRDTTQGAFTSFVDTLNAADEATDAASRPEEDPLTPILAESIEERSPSGRTSSSSFKTEAITPIWDQPKPGSTVQPEQSKPDRFQPTLSKPDQSEPVLLEPTLVEPEHVRPPAERQLVRKPTRRTSLDDELDDILIIDDLEVVEVVPLRKDHKVVPLKRTHEIVDAEIIFFDE
jgi:hypothetical protein